MVISIMPYNLCKRSRKRRRSRRSGERGRRNGKWSRLGRGYRTLEEIDNEEVMMAMTLQ